MNIYKYDFLHCAKSSQKTGILLSLDLWRYKVWNYQGGLERGSLPHIQQANSKEADRIPVSLENEGKPVSICQNSIWRSQKKKKKKEAKETHNSVGLPTGLKRKWN